MKQKIYALMVGLLFTILAGPALADNCGSSVTSGFMLNLIDQSAMAANLDRNGSYTLLRSQAETLHKRWPRPEVLNNRIAAEGEGVRQLYTADMVTLRGLMTQLTSQVNAALPADSPWRLDINPVINAMSTEPGWFVSTFAKPLANAALLVPTDQSNMLAFQLQLNHAMEQPGAFDPGNKVAYHATMLNLRILLGYLGWQLLVSVLLVAALVTLIAWRIYATVRQSRVEYQALNLSPA